MAVRLSVLVLVVAVVCTTYTPYIASFLGKYILGATSFNLSEQIALRPHPYEFYLYFDI